MRLVKIIKKKGKMMDKMAESFGLSEGVEKMLFSLVIFLMFSHFSACFWIYTAEMTEDPEEDNATNWIHSGEYDSLSKLQLYLTSLYFTVTTMTTVGYGDISGTNTGERIVCMFLMIMGVLFFTYTSGMITNIITNEEEENKKY